MNEIELINSLAPRITSDHIDSVIVSIYYFTAEQGVRQAYKDNDDVMTEQAALSLPLMTFCVLVLKNGYTVVGQSACASPENFNAEFGRKIALENAKEKIWSLEGYLLKNKLWAQKEFDNILFERVSDD